MRIFVILVCIVVVVVCQIAITSRREAPTVGSERVRTVGRWSNRVGYAYPPGLDGVSRSDLADAEVEVVEALWYETSWRRACERAGLYDDQNREDGTVTRVFPRVARFDRLPTGLQAVVIPGDTRVTVADLAAAVGPIFQTIPGDHRVSVEEQRTSVLYRVESRDPLAGMTSADELLGAAPADSRPAAEIEDDFFDALGGDDRE